MALFSPGYNARGIRDLTLLPQVISEDEFGQHLAKFFIKAAKGDYESSLLSGAEAVAKHGSESFSIDGGFRNHQSVFLEGAMATSMVVIQRIDMGGTGAKLTHYIDVAEVELDVKLRQPDGGVDGAAATYTGGESALGLKIKHVVMNDGTPVIQDGTMTNQDGTPSKMYPIFNYNTEDGSYYNNLGYTLRPLKTDKNEIVRNGQFLYDFAFKETIDGFVGTRPTISGAPTAKLGLLEGISPLTKDSIRFQDVVEYQYSNTTNRARGWVYPDFTIETFEGNIETVLKLIELKEKTFIEDAGVTHEDVNGDPVIYSDWFDVADGDYTDASFKLFNLVTAESSTKVPYLTVVVDDTAIAPVVPAKLLVNVDSVLKFDGGTDTQVFADADAEYEHYLGQVRGHLSKYADPDSEFMETALHPESVMYDSGFDVITKKAFTDFISLRKDTGIHLSTYITDLAGTRVMTVEEEIAIAKIIKGRLDLAPESTYYNTEVARATIEFGSCNIVNSTYKDRVPTTYDLMRKLSAFMGAGEKKWVRARAFDSGDESACNFIENILPKVIPRAVKDELWAIGVNYTEPLYTKRVYHWVAFGTVSKDTSALNNVMVMHAAMWAQRVQIKGWKKFTGSNQYSRNAFINVTEDFLREEIRGAFDGRFIVIPRTVISEDDIRYGTHWSTDIELQVNDSYTIVNTSVTVRRKF